MKQSILEYYHVLILNTAMLSSCASYEVTKVDKTSKVQGGRFFRPAPYLLIGISTDNAKSESVPTLTARLIYLPDKSQEYVIHRKSGLGTAEVTANLQDGWKLVTYGGKTDSKIPETITAVASLATSIAGLPLMEGATEFPSPGLWRLEFNDSTGHVTNIVPVRAVQV